MDITPLTNKELKLITKYKDELITINDVTYTPPLIIIENQVITFATKHLTIQELLQLPSFKPDKAQIILIGTGTKPDFSVRTHFKSFPTIPEIMTTPAAIRTYNILAMEDRKVSLILL
ncbi:Mth938-like domain-containing protein [Rickettsiales endosymbiont of Stachyamoeba lipophora]|uniref:Mth938-like domain-containing protein n=1 Tax=Rickettsiales endosymbiont of Stachyamoeba lipophora TaxID=2486578 RepID=UPI000F648326|nr:Mth938-like domain-containing protein [Rickettsiales endosymbiont of Stachyamoeba lipophora]AZL15422.1 hypothetical protein EF513_02495 [Rickettsiales endosymbiont of Stachyamoeba lipophora]